MRKKKFLVDKIIFNFQKILLAIAYKIFVFVKTDDGLWVLGVNEVSSIISRTSIIFKKSYSVNFFFDKYSEAGNYSFDINKIGFLKPSYLRFILGPILLAYLARKAEGFFYVSDSGFLINCFDARKHEFEFLKRADKKIAVFFVGSDIRSPYLSLEYGRENNMDVMMKYIQLLDGYNSEAIENQVKATAKVADQYADYIFSAQHDQLSYLVKDVHFNLLSYPEDLFYKNADKFKNVERLKILHAPSSPFIKGTPVIRAAIKKLEVMGYVFDYIEITNETNETVLDHLRSSHIVINQIYSTVPGMFGVEALASNCAVLMSADPALEKDLPEGAEDAWMVTAYWEVFDNLKMLLDNSELIKEYADNGYDWAYKNCRSSAMRARMNQILEMY